MSSQKILIIDDEAELVTLTAKMLSAHGYEVMPYHQGGGALDVIRRFLPDLVLLDIILPDVSGLDLLKTIHQDSQFSSLPVLLFSAVSRSIELNPLKEGAQGMIGKPFESKELLGLIKETLAGRKEN